jgi:hypothetical protein
MPETVTSNMSEKQVAEFQKRQLRDFKYQQNLELMLSRRERKAVAPGFPCSEASLCDWLKEGGPAAMGAQWLPAWTREVGPGLLRWIAKECGFDLVDEDEAGPVEVTDSAQLLALIAVHHGRLMGQIIQAREDGNIDDQEREEIWPEVCRLIRELEAEAEYFRPLRRERAAGGDR